MVFALQFIVIYMINSLYSNDLQIYNVNIYEGTTVKEVEILWKRKLFRNFSRKKNKRLVLG